MASARVGTATVAFGSSGFSALLTGASGYGYSRAVVDTTNNSSVGQASQAAKDAGQDWSAIVVRTFAPGSISPNPVTLECSFDPDDAVPIIDGTETLTITFPKLSGDVGAPSCVNTGFCSNFTVDDFGNFDAPITATVEFTTSSDWTYTDSTQA